MRSPGIPSVSSCVLPLPEADTGADVIVAGPSCWSLISILRMTGAARAASWPKEMWKYADVLLGLATPGRRREFMEAVAAAVEQAGSGAGVGLVHGWRARFKGGLCSRRNGKRRSPPRRAILGRAGRAASRLVGLPPAPPV
jgi:hypothetical protein